jgi:hypothetical protein
MRRVDKSDTNILKKWRPVIENKFNLLKNDIVINLLCLYCEWFCSDEVGEMSSKGSHDLANKLFEIDDKINSFNRIEIVGQYFNPASGIVEVMLVNGDFIPNKGCCKYEISEKDRIELFGKEFMDDLEKWLYYTTDKQKFRERNIDKVLI